MGHKTWVICAAFLVLLSGFSAEAQIPGPIQTGITQLTGDCTAGPGSGAKAITCTKTGGVAFTASATSPVSINKLTVSAVTTATTLTLPANAVIEQILVVNTTSNAVTGGIKIGSTLGGTDVVTALAVGANAVTSSIGSLSKSFFSASATQTIYFDAVGAWNSASVNITILYAQM